MRHPYKTARCILYRDDTYLLAVHSRFWRASQRRWGLPGGQIERGESPQAAAARELEEELNIVDPHLVEVGAYRYKHALHMVYAAPLEHDIDDFDDRELVDICWFSERQVADLKSRSALHADYELEAIRHLVNQLSGAEVRAAAS